MPNSLKCIKNFFKIDSSHNASLPNLGIVCYVGSQVLRFASTQIRRYSDLQVLRYSDLQILRYSDLQVRRFCHFCPWGTPYNTSNTATGHMGMFNSLTKV